MRQTFFERVPVLGQVIVVVPRRKTDNIFSPYCDSHFLFKPSKIAG